MKNPTGGILFLYAETPVHPGTGTRVSFIDLPVQRERPTGFPIITASSLKGALRNWAHRCGWSPQRIALFFGPGEDLGGGEEDERLDDTARPAASSASGSRRGEEDERLHDPSAFAGSLALTDARVLLFPVRSMAGVFAWVTCPMQLARLKRDVDILGAHIPADWTVALDTVRSVSNATEVWGSVEKPDVVVPNTSSKQVVLEEYTFEYKQHSNLMNPVIQMLKPLKSDPLLATLENRLLVVHDEVFADLVTMGTEVLTRVRIDPITGTAAEKALWTEELVPSETLFWSVFLMEEDIYFQKHLHKRKSESEGSGKATPAPPESLPKNGKEAVDQWVQGINKNPILQLGGDATLGRGIFRLAVWSPPPAQASETET